MLPIVFFPAALAWARPRLWERYIGGTSDPDIVLLSDTSGIQRRFVLPAAWRGRPGPPWDICGSGPLRFLFDKALRGPPSGPARHGFFPPSERAGPGTGSVRRGKPAEDRRPR